MTLKHFIKTSGLLLLVASVASTILFAVICVGHFVGRRVTGLAGVAEGTCVILIMGIIAMAGWRMFRYWNEGVIAEYVFIQAAITAYLLGFLLHPYLSGWSSLIGVIFFLVTARRLNTFLVKFLAVPRIASRQAASQV